MATRLVLLGGVSLAKSFATPLIVSLVLLFPGLSIRAHAQVTQTIGPGSLGTQVNQVGNIYEITQGTRAGSNLFHSFGNFNISSVETARFQTTNLVPDATIGNILGRVTGGNPSSIFGTINSATYYPSANLFLMNPAGIVFGPNAVINVGGMAHFTTADYLRLDEVGGPNAGIFHADLAQTSLLTTAPVTAFGFLGSNPAAIAVQGSQLAMTDGTGLSLIGGNRGFTYTNPDTITQASVQDGVTVTGGTRISAPNGEINLAVTASPGEFLVAGLQAAPNINGESFTSYGAVHLAPGSTIDVSGTNTVSIRGGQFVLSINDAALSTAGSYGPADTISLSPGSSIVSLNAGAAPGADVQIIAETLQLDGASVQTLVTGDGQGGNISLGGQNIIMTNGGQIVTRTDGGGTGGAISINANDSVTVSGFAANDGSSGITNPNLFNPETFEPLVASGLYTVSSGSGNGGAVSITAPRVIMENGGTILSATSGDGNGGSISLSGDSISLTGGSMIFSSSGKNLNTFETGGTGRGGDITLSASQSILLEGGNLDVFALTTIFTQANHVGRSGNISLSSPEVSIQNGAAIATQTFGTGAGGNISVTAPTLLSVSGFNADFGSGSSIGTSTSSDGNGGRIDVTAGTVRVEDGGSIGTNSSGLGSGGDVDIVAAHDIFVQRGGAISTGGFAEGDSGSVSLTAGNTVFLSEPFDPTFPVVIYSNQEGSGAKGNINVTAHDVVLTNGAEILSSSQNQAQGGGAVSVGATGSITVSNGGGIRAFGGSQGNPPITLVAPEIMLDQALVSSRTASSQNGGAITLHATAGDLTLRNNTHVLTSTEQSSGNAGQIVALASGSISLSGNSTMESRSSSVARGDGGSVTLTAGDMVSLSGTGTALSTTTGGRGNGGSVTVNGQSVELHDHASISSNTTGRVTDGGKAGDILIKADTFSLNSGATITASSTGTGAAGTVTIEGIANPAQSVLIDGANSGVFTTTSGTGAGGNIVVKANSVTLQNGGMLSAATTGTAPSAIGGTITVNAANTVTMSGGASMTASSNGAADGGNINVTGMNGITMQNSVITTEVAPPAPNTTSAGGGNIKLTTAPAATVELVNSKISASVADGPGGGGNIVIDPQFVILRNSQILAQAVGQGGTITITTYVFLQDSVSVVSADSGTGLNGTVNIQSPLSQLGGKLSPLPKNSLESTTWINSRCRALAGGQASSFVVAGRDMLPTEPGGWLGSPVTGLTGEPVFSAHVPSFPQIHMAPSQEGTVSLRRMTPPGFLLQAFATDQSADCTS